MQYAPFDVVGVDLSLTRTGLCLIKAWDDHVTETRLVKSLPDDGTLESRVERLETLRQTIVAAVPAGALVAIEAPSYGSANQQAGKRHDRSGLWWLVVDSLAHQLGAQIVEIPPRSRAMYASGSGNGAKTDVVDAVRYRWHPEVKDHNIADAITLAAMARAHLDASIDLPGRMTPARNSIALTGVRWPTGKETL